MTSVNPAIREVLEATEHLPNGASLVVPQVSWDDYELLVEEFNERNLRVSYDCGRLEIVSPLPEHQGYGRFIEQMVVAFSDAFDVEVESRGNATWKDARLPKEWNRTVATTFRTLRALSAGARSILNRIRLQTSSWKSTPRATPCASSPFTRLWQSRRSGVTTAKPFRSMN
jgi:hypothetical protein